MEKNFVLDGNKLIAEFMGYEYIPFNNQKDLRPGWWKKGITKLQQDRQGILRKIGHSNFLCRRHHELRYWNSWDWLIPVIKKISQLDYSIDSKLHHKILQVESNYIIESRGTIFSQVVEFIEWYNENI